MKNTQLYYIWSAMRPKQWLKNSFVFAALVFDQQLFSWPSLRITILAAGLFCLVSSMVYIINDLADFETDRLHPVKKDRPLASGKLSKRTSIITVILIALIVFPVAFLTNTGLGITLAVYLCLMLAYSYWLKNLVLIDVMVIAAGFVLRVTAGVLVIKTQLFSPWLFVSTLLLALFIGLGKRRAEIALLETQATAHRRVLGGYTLDLLDQLLTIVLSTTLMTYCLYTFSAALLPGNYFMMLTIPFVIYGLFRYLYLIRVESFGGAPEEIILTDRPMQAAIGFWGLTVLVIIYLLY